MKLSVPVSILLLIITAACAPLVELEDENTALRGRIDSLEIVLGECHAQANLLQERLAAIERENLQLDDRNRQLGAKLAELRYGQSEEVQSGTATVPAAESVSTGTGRPGVVPPVTPVVPGGGERVPDYRSATAPDLNFLREYQSALSAYNGKEYTRAARLFSGLLMTSPPNDMIDNCVYWLGETHLQLGELDEAYGRFSTVLGYEGSDKIPSALVSRARVSIARGDNAAARSDLERCMKEFPGSEQTAAARRLLRKL